MAIQNKHLDEDMSRQLNRYYKNLMMDLFGNSHSYEQLKNKNQLRQFVNSLFEELPSFESEILYHRYKNKADKMEIADRLGRDISIVSEVLEDTLEYLKDCIVNEFYLN